MIWLSSLPTDESNVEQRLILIPVYSTVPQHFIGKVLIQAARVTVLDACLTEKTRGTPKADFNQVISHT